MSFAAAVRDALAIPNPHESEERVHETVARQIERITPGVRVRRTGYFNHSWAPDLVVADDQEDRRIYLRFDVKNPSFAPDLVFLAKERPIFLDLVAANPDAQPTPEDQQVDLQEALRQNDGNECLITEVPAVDQFDAGVETNRDLQTATEQVVLGGRGVVDSAAADRIVDSWGQATGAIEEASREGLRAALDIVETYLSRVSSLDLETHLRARWIGAGLAAEQFPGREDWSLIDRAPWEIARLVMALVKQDAPVDPDRWVDIAQAISASELGHELYKIGDYRHGGAVSDLVRAALPYWTAEYAYVPSLESDTFDRFDWAIGSYSIELSLVRRRAFFTDIGRKWTRMPRGNPLPNARDRLASLTDSGVTGVGIITPEENVSHELREDATASLAERLEPLLGDAGDAAWRAARITWLEARVPGTAATVRVDFDRSVVHTTEAVPLRTYALMVGRLVAGLDDNELRELEASFDSEAPGASLA